MKVGWVSHQWPTPDDTPARNGLMPGRYAGGAEFLQDMMRGQAPDGVDIVEFDTAQPISNVEACDRLVVSATELLSPSDLDRLARLSPVVWLMSPQRPEVTPLLDSADKVVWASDLMRSVYGHKGHEVCPGWWDTSVVPRGVRKEPFAMWAGRDTWQKGEAQARNLAADNGIPFLALKNRPRAEVLETMGRARWFIHLSQGVIDPCPTTVIEAEIAGCEIVTNDLVGRTPVRGAERNVEYIGGCAEMFWQWVCG